MDTELLRLLNAATDGSLSEADTVRLQELLACEGSSAEFDALMDVHFKLAENTAPVRAFSMKELRAVSEVESRFQDAKLNKPDDPASGPLTPKACPPAGRQSGPSMRGQWLWFAGGLAASAMLILPLTSFFNRTDPVVSERDVPAPTQRDADQSDVAARIVRKIDCVWDSDRWMVSAPVHFGAGEQINLSSGLLVLEFQSGAQVTLQGPANATALSGNALSLSSGGLTATVPEQARGFTVHTNSGEIVDLGTEFGVLAGQDGSVETHVFKGEVVTRLGAAKLDPSLDGVSITAGKAQLFSSSGSARTTSAEPSRFLRLGFGLDDQQLKQPPTERGLVLWLAADGRVQLDDQDRVMAWGDNPADTNTSLEDTWQIRGPQRPLWVEDAINGRPAIQFGGNRILVSEPIELGSSVTTSLVFRLESSRVKDRYKRMRATLGNQAEVRPDLGLQLLNLYGPPHPVVQIEEDASLRARVHLGLQGYHIYDNDMGVTQTSPILDDAAHVVVYSMDSREGVARLFLDGAFVAEVPAKRKMSPTFTPRYVGQHPYRPEHGFPGEIAEIMVHDTALAPQEVANLSDWLGRKYGIPIASE